MAVSEVPGLRERKRRRTRDAIARAALELFERQGFRATTIPEIADAADVSPRTVSGYFPSKEELAFPHADADLASLSARLRDRRAGESATEALRAWVSEALSGSEASEEERAARRRVIRSDEHLRSHQRALLARFRAPIAEAIARDLGRPSDDIEARMAAAATLTILELLSEDEQAANATDVRAALQSLDRVLLFVNGGIAALHGGNP